MIADARLRLSRRYYTIYIGMKNINKFRSKLLCVLDNLERFPDIEDYLYEMPERARVIIATRNLELHPMLKQNSIGMSYFSIEEAIQYLDKALATQYQTEDLKLHIGAIVKHYTRDGLAWPLEISLQANHILNNDTITFYQFLKTCIEGNLATFFKPLIKFIRKMKNLEPCGN